MNQQKLIDLLLALKANDTRHSGRNLMKHLLGTYDILKGAGCDEQVCLAGGLHSIYGTDVFKTRTLPLSARPDVAKAFGVYAEQLAYIFGHTPRRTRTIEDGYVGWPRCQLHDLRLIEAANLLEQGGSLDKWPNIKAAWERQLAVDRSMTT